MVEFPPEDMMRNLNVLQERFRRRIDAAGEGIPGTITSYIRSRQRNAEVGGAKHSQHLYGLAMDIVVSRADWARTIDALRAQHLVVIDEGDHIHAQLLPGSAFAALLGPGARL